MGTLCMQHTALLIKEISICWEGSLSICCNSSRGTVENRRNTEEAKRCSVGRSMVCLAKCAGRKITAVVRCLSTLPSWTLIVMFLQILNVHAL